MSLALVVDPYLNIRHIEFLDVEWLSGMFNVCVKTVNQTSIIGFFMVRKYTFNYLYFHSVSLSGDDSALV